MADYYIRSENAPSVAVPQPISSMHPMQHTQSIQPTHTMHPVDASKYQTSAFNVDFKEIIKRTIKYLIEGIVVGAVAYFITKHRVDFKDVVMIGVTAAFVFAILDIYSPTVSLGARFGAGFGIGQALFGVTPGIITTNAPMLM